MDDYQKFVDLIKSSANIVFFGGAGVSTESNIPDFRSSDGLYNLKYPFPPEVMLSHNYFIHSTKEFFDFYRDKLLLPWAKPNITHLKLTKLEKAGKLQAIVTQNIDGLHEMAQSKNILNLHGTVYKNHCMRCGKSHSMEFVKNSKEIPLCECGGIVKPDVVLYGECLDEKTVSLAEKAIANADVLIVGGTSLVVYPAAGLIDFYHGNKLILVNKDSTSFDQRADLIFHESLGNLFNLL